MLSLVGIIQNNFVFVPICPIADLADASDVFPAQPASYMSLFSLLFFDGTAICIYKSLMQEMGGRTVARNEDWAFAVGANGHGPFSFRATLVIFCQKAAGCIIRPVKLQNAAQGNVVRESGIVVGQHTKHPADRYGLARYRWSKLKIPCLNLRPAGMYSYVDSSIMAEVEHTEKSSNKSLQATRDGRSSSASRFTSFGPACLSSER